MDPLEVLKRALSAPQGSDDQRNVLGQLRAQLELQPGLIHPLCTMLVPTIAHAADSLMKHWVLDLLHYALSRSSLPVDAKSQLAAQCLDVLMNLLNDPSQQTVKAVVQIFANVYPLLFRTLCINRNPIAQWDTLTRAKKQIVDLLESATPLGVKEAALKFVHRVIQVQTRGVSDPRLQNTADPNLTSCPSNHPFINAGALEAEGNTLIQLVLTLLFSSPSADLISSLVNSWAPLVKHRPGLLPICVRALTTWTPAALVAAGASPRDVKSVEKAVRILLLHINRSPHGAPFQHEIGPVLHAQEQRMKAAEVTSKKRAADESAGQNGANKRPKLDADAAPALSAAQLAQFDFSILPAPLVVEFIIANLQKIPEERLLAAVAKYNESKGIAAAPVPGPSTTEAAAQPVVVKTEPLDPLKMDMDDEAEITNFDSERVDKQVALAVTGDAVAPAAPGEPEPEAILRLAEFVAPPPVKLSQAQRDKALATIDRRAYEAAGEVDAASGEVDGPKTMTRGAELQAVLLVRSITRSGLEEYDAVEENDMQVDGRPKGRNAMREKLCAYVLEDLPSRVRLANLWMNEEWYNDRIQRERDADVVQHYGVWLRRLLDGYRSRLDAKDRTFARFLLDLPELSDELLHFMRDLCLDQDKMQVGFTTLRELVALRMPVRKAALAILLDMTTHPERITRNAAIITVKRWVPDTQPMDRLVQRFALQMLRRLCVIPAPPKPEPTTEDSDEDGQLPQEEEQADDSIPAYVPVKLEGPADRAVVLQHVELVFALCIKVPDLLDEIFAAYGRMEASVQEAMQDLITQLVKSLGPNHGKLLTLLRTFPPGADSLALRVLNIFTENAKPTAPLVAVVKGLVAERDLDARFLIPIMAEMDKADVVKHLPRIVSILNGKPEEQAIVRSLFTTVVASPPSAIGTSNQPRTRQSDMLTPAELMVMLHEQEMEIGLKPTIEAINICFSMSDIFGQEVLAVVMQQIVDEPQLPVLFLRTVIQAVRTYRSLIGFVSTTLLSRLITKKIWQNPKLWDGFVMCSKIIAPASFGALLQLPKDQLRDLVHKEPGLKAGLRDYVIKKAGNKQRVAHFLEVFGEDNGTPDGSPAPTPPQQAQATAVGS
ncbi:hypothetical protein EXIGLDRAFT_674317 [Exidia glandulosa HHB12029]|uniref:Symplekin n=1 Tax=Exidia glandulosa HHB12029 TaxID=1314781 RepID=A0A165IA31_EXIGL|nr:hypothetical protein EXIGLDRAFT_674317 [Exidia glandulosa HHB12029]